jgi:Spy/CpxP family protein refolding chaperone
LFFSTHNRLVRRALLATALALPISATALGGQASAASMSTWDHLAECESGGDWHMNTGNGFYGGLQFTDGTWDSFGGDKFAPRADRADKHEQIRIAQRVLNDQGWSAWPGCSVKLGLRR